MEPQYCLRSNKAVFGTLLPRSTPILEILKTVKTFKIEFRDVEREESTRKKTNEKGKSKNNQKVSKVMMTRKGKKKDIPTSKDHSKSEENLDKKKKDSRVGWSYKGKKNNLVYCDRFDMEEVLMFRQMEMEWKLKKERELCKKHGILPCVVKIKRYEIYKCKHCPSKFTSRRSRMFHEMTHKEKVEECLRCGKTFTLRKYLLQHEDTHIKMKRYKCNICDKRYKHASSLSQHKRREHRIRSTKVIEEKLQRMKKILANRKPKKSRNGSFRCDECDESFSLKACLANHKRTHLKIRKFKCLYCEATYNLYYQLRCHMRSRHKTKVCRFIED